MFRFAKELWEVKHDLWNVMENCVVKSERKKQHLQMIVNDFMLLEHFAHTT